MQKLCALLLLILSAWLLVAPFAAAPGEQKLLPACCRRLGAHHCTQQSGSVNATTMIAGDTHQASFRSTGCLLMPHHSLALLRGFTGSLSFAALALLACLFPFFSPGASAGYARALALKSPRGPPRLSFA